MQIILSSQSDKPIYEQIFLQIKGQIMDGTLSPGTELPSMRTLAKDLQVSVITTKKAYEELIRAGFVISIRGKGCYVAELDLGFLQKQTIQTIRETFKHVASQAISENISLETLQAELFSCYTIKQKERNSHDKCD